MASCRCCSASTTPAPGLSSHPRRDPQDAQAIPADQFPVRAGGPEEQSTRVLNELVALQPGTPRRRFVRGSLLQERADRDGAMAASGAC